MGNQIILEDLAKQKQSEYPYQIVLARVKGKLTELHKAVDEELVDQVEFLTMADNAGMLTFKRSATLLLLRAVYDVIAPEDIECFKVEYSVSKGYYCTLKGKVELTTDLIETIEARMREMAALDLPIAKMSIDIMEAVDLFGRLGMHDKEKLFRYRRNSKVNVYSLDGYMDYFYGYMVPSTGYIQKYKLYPYDEGLVIQFPSRKSPDQVAPFQPQNKVFAALKEATKWGEMLDIETVGDLNELIAHGDQQTLILVQEALQEKRLGDIAGQIAGNPAVKFVMIAGPSSSGKTTTSYRICVQLRAHGKRPHQISLDNYFVNREDTPLDEDGKLNFECLEALDVELFNKDMSALLAGETVQIPEFNFVTGQREYNGNYMTLAEDDILVIEGIHGLNDKLSYTLPKESKFKIYLSALTQLNVDEHNRIPTTDGRMLRRIVRDARTRGASAKRTIEMWESVRRGEEENIFPFQEEADVIFNSSSIYELAVLKTYAEPLLFAITPEEPEFDEAKRLLKFLDYFLAMNYDWIPNNSIVREFIGGSCFKV